MGKDLAIDPQKIRDFVEVVLKVFEFSHEVRTDDALLGSQKHVLRQEMYPGNVQTQVGLPVGTPSDGSDPFKFLPVVPYPYDEMVKGGEFLEQVRTIFISGCDPVEWIANEGPDEQVVRKLSAFFIFRDRIMPCSRVPGNRRQGRPRGLRDVDEKGIQFLVVDAHTRRKQ